MLYISQANKYRKRKTVDLLILILLLCLISVSLLSSVFISVYADHDCIGHGCHICVMIDNAKSIIEQLIRLTTFIIVACLFVLAIPVLTGSFVISVIFETPIKAKVKLNS
ncbi:MAG: hypothetical protein FWD05_07285 [Oscillospiraceae bacterium]|nr:hypothetical protein [Oscillospiraceae bacterium]